MDSLWHTRTQVVRITPERLPSYLRRSEVRFWGWAENKREEEMDLAELRQRVAEGKPLYPESTQPGWIQDVAYRNSVWSQLKFRKYLPRPCLPLAD